MAYLKIEKGCYYIVERYKKDNKWSIRYLLSLGKISPEKAKEYLEQWKLINQVKPIYRTIVIDPPWPIDKIKREVRPNQVEMDYKTMTIEEIKNFPIQKFMHKNGCHLYLWTTQKHLRNAFEVMDHWNVNYHCLMTWVKNVGITPFHFMYSTEFVLFGMVGNLSLIKKGERLDFKGNVREHSRKPNEFYDIAKKVSPDPRIDIFSREKREGFDQYGIEPRKF